MRDTRTLRSPGLLKSRWTHGLLLAVAALVVYINAIPSDFAYDDVHIVEDREVLTSLSEPGEIFLSPWWPIGEASTGDQWRPVTLFSYAIDHAIWGDSATGYHVTNVGLHVLATLLLFLLLGRLPSPPWASLLGALAFALHPVHTEAVANLVGRAEVLATLFVLGGLWLWLSERVSLRVRLAGVGGLYLLALGSKEVGVALPALLVLAEALRLARDRGGGFWREAWGTAREPGWLRRSLPAVASSVVVFLFFMALRAVALGQWALPGTVSLVDHVSGAEDLAHASGEVTGDLEEQGGGGHSVFMTAVSLWRTYAALLFFPLNLSVDYGPGVVVPVSSPDLAWWLTLFGGVGTLALAALCWSRLRILSVAILWFWASILVVSNLLFPIGTWLPERSLYLPSVALSILIAGGAACLASHPLALRRAALGAVLAYLAFFGWRTVERNPVWYDTDTVMQSLVDDRPSSYRAQWRIGNRLRASGSAEEALPYFRRALTLNPTRPRLPHDFAGALMDAGHYEDAARVLADVDYVLPVDEASRLIEAYVELEDWDRVASLSLELLERVDSDAERELFSHFASMGLEGTGDTEGAVIHRTRALESAANDESVRYHREVLDRLERGDGGVLEMERGLEESPATEY